MPRPNKLFKSNGHRCHVYEDLDPLIQYIPGYSRKNRMKRWIFRYTMISDTHDLATRHLRSQGGVQIQKVKQLRERKYLIIHPFSTFCLYWEGLLVFTFFAGFIIKPAVTVLYFWCKMKVSFTFSVVNGILLLLNNMDIFFNFFFGYYDEKRSEVILVHKMIVKRYLCTYFFVDFLADVPFDLPYQLTELIAPNMKNKERFFNILILTRFLALFRFTRMIHCSNRLIKVLGIPSTIAKCVGILLLTALFVHVFLCMLVVYVELFTPPANVRHATMLDCDNQFESIMNNYVTFFYELIREMLLAAFPRFIGYNYVSIIQAMLTWSIMWILTVRLIVSLYLLMEKANPPNHYEEMVTQLKDYIKTKKLPDYMHQRLLIYYQFRYRGNYFKEAEILNAIGNQLKQEVLSHNYHTMIEKVGFFKNLPKPLLYRIASHLELEVYLPNDVIIHVETPGDCMFFIATGTVAVYDMDGKEMHHLEDDDFFGEIALISTDNLRRATVVAVHLCELYKLQRTQFIKAIMPYPDLLIEIQNTAAERLSQLGSYSYDETAEVHKGGQGKKADPDHES